MLGAEKLLGKGDGLFKDANGNLNRTQALFIDDANDGEFTRILTYMKENFEAPQYFDYLQERVDSGQVAWAKNDDGTLSDSIVDIVIKKKSIF
jgi:DNA segregation ATPase FtsK/SpoIIIE-like protein